jgi:hypothetical protein
MSYKVEVSFTFNPMASGTFEDQLIRSLLPRSRSELARILGVIPDTAKRKLVRMSKRTGVKIVAVGAVDPIYFPASEIKMAKL